MSKYEEQKEHFKRAYITGTDIWTHAPRDHRGVDLVRELKPNSLVLDIGYGRGVWTIYLAKLGFRVVGIDYVKETMEQAKANAEAEGVGDKVKFIEADILTISSGENNFDAVTDFGLFHNLLPEDWTVYKTNVSRVLKPGGLFLLEALSKETTKFVDLNPKGSPESRFEKYGVSYYFFTEEEIKNFFGDNFEILEVKHEYPFEGQAILSVLMKKK